MVGGLKREFVPWISRVKQGQDSEGMMLLDVDTCPILFADGVLYKREQLWLREFRRG
jgi:hypothetical protein